MSSHHFKKALSQNFLYDQSIIKKMVQLVDLQPKDHVLEVGPGKGALTKELVKTNAEVIAIEIDETLTESLQSLRERYSNFHFYISDFRTIDLDAICNAPSLKFISSLPYHLSSLFIQKICLMHKKLKTATLLVQKEVAERICAKNGKSYNFLSVFVQFFSNPQYITTVPKTCFYPMPNVDSAILHLTFIPPKLDPSDLFFSFVKKCFQGKRKQLINCLASHFDIEAVRQGFLDLHINETTRAEMLSVDQLLALYTYLKNSCLSQ